MEVVDHPSSNFGDRAKGSTIDKLVLHYTGMPNTEVSLARICDKTSEVSAHYLINEAGKIYHLVDEKNRAWHAGVSYWDGQTDINSQSIGIELQNPGHEWGYQKFSDLQISALIELSTDVIARHEIPSKNVVGHSDIAPDRKQDPGELFPWRRLAEMNIGYWPMCEVIPEPTDQRERKLRETLSSLGYDPAASLQGVVRAFQRHFRPTNILGRIDIETAQLIYICAKTT